jgi:hypothetical protein
MPAAAARPRLVFHLSAWDGPSKVALIQGLVRDPVTGEYFITQADNVAGQVQPNLVIRRHLPNLSYADSRTVARGGHGSTVGIEHDGRSMIWLGHGQHGVGRFAFEDGPSSFKQVSSLPDGDVSVHRDVACVRNKNRFRGYRLSDAKAGRTTQLFDFTIPAWGKRFQGHAVISQSPTSGLVCVHRDVATKKASRAMAFTFAGVKTAEIDTTGMGDEAEGFLIEEGQNGSSTVWVVKRTGPLDPKRRIVAATLWLGDLPVTDTVPVEPERDITAVFALFGAPKALKVSSTVKAARGGYTSRYTHYVQKWLIVLGYYRAKDDGRWGPVTQTAFDTFRRNIRPPWPESDCIGIPGITSLTLLRNAAVKATGKDQLEVIP